MSNSRLYTQEAVPCLVASLYHMLLKYSTYGERTCVPRGELPNAHDVHSDNWRQKQVKSRSAINRNLQPSTPVRGQDLHFKRGNKLTFIGTPPTALHRYCFKSAQTFRVLWLHRNHDGRIWHSTHNFKATYVCRNQYDLLYSEGLLHFHWWK